jgi:hypothetical protein
MENNVVESDGDRFADVVENVKLHESLVHVLHYVKDISENDLSDHDALICHKMLESMQANTVDAIGGAIE